MTRRMTRDIVATALLTVALLATPALAKAHKPSKAHKPNASGSITYNRDSPNPNVGWHWEGGLRVCTQDCDNPEIPGSGYTCRTITFMGMKGRECDR